MDWIEELKINNLDKTNFRIVRYKEFLYILAFKQIPPSINIYSNAEHSNDSNTYLFRINLENKEIKSIRIKSYYNYKDFSIYYNDDKLYYSVFATPNNIFNKVMSLNLNPIEDFLRQETLKFAPQESFNTEFNGLVFKTCFLDLDSKYSKEIKLKTGGSITRIRDKLFLFDDKFYEADFTSEVYKKGVALWNEIITFNYKPKRLSNYYSFVVNNTIIYYGGNYFDGAKCMDFFAFNSSTYEIKKLDIKLNKNLSLENFFYYKEKIYSFNIENSKTTLVSNILNIFEK